MSAISSFIKRQIHQSPIIIASTLFAVAGTAAAAAAYYQGYKRGPEALLTYTEADNSKYFMRELAYEIDQLLKSEGMNLQPSRQAVYVKLGNVKKYYDALNALESYDTEEAKELKANFQKAVLTVAYDLVSTQREEKLEDYLPKKDALFKRLGLTGPEIPIAPLALPAAPKVEDVKVPRSNASREEVIAYFNDLANVVMKN